MNFEFTGRHIDVTEALKAHVLEHFSKVTDIIGDSEDRPSSAHVIMEVERPGSHRSEIILNWKGENLTASSVDTDMYLSLNQTIDKVAKQARKLHDKMIDKSHKGVKTSVVVSEADGSIQP